MSLRGPVILIEDDENDAEILQAALRENNMPNEIIVFTKARDALEYLTVTNDLPFIMLCDIRLPGMNGLEFRSVVNLNEFLRKKSIPFIFLTAAVSPQIVSVAYDMTVQGFFEKANTYEALKVQLNAIVSYWSKCLHPNNYLHL